jgi:O-antigen ligase
MRRLAVGNHPLKPAPVDCWPAFGLALTLFGQPIGWWIRGTLSAGDSPVYPAAVSLLGLAIVAIAGLQRPPRLHVEPLVAALPVCFVLLPVIALALIDVEAMVVELAYGIFLLVLAMTIWCIPTSRLDCFPRQVALVAAISCGLALLTFALNPIGAFVGRLTVAGNDNTIVVGNTGAVLMIATLTLIVSEPAGPGRRILHGLLLAVGLACLFLSNTRSAMLGFLLAGPLTVWLCAVPRGQGRLASIRIPLLVLGILVAAAVTAGALFIGLDKLAILFEDFVNRLSGVFRGFGDASALNVPDQSTQERVLLLSEAWRQSGLLGNGVNTMAHGGGAYEAPGKYPHLSYLQVLLDLGILPFLVYLLVMLVVPLRLVIQVALPRAMAPMPAFVIGLWAFKQADLFTHSTPYDWFNIYPTVLLFALLARPMFPARLVAQTS